MTKALTLVAGADDDGRRLDRALRKALPDVPLSAIHGLLRKGRVLVDGVPGSADYRIRAGAVIQVPVEEGGAVPAGEEPGASDSAFDLESQGLAILWESADLLVLNKPAGVAVHGPDRPSSKSLETLVRAYLAPKLAPSLSFRSGPLHRLDRPTSGIIVFSKTLGGARNFSALLRERRIRKTYLAILEGRLRRDEAWEDVLVRDRELGKSFAAAEGSPSEGRPREARTRVCPLALSSGARGFTLARLELDTGRTHQIRAQAATRGHPLAGDRKYGGSAQRGGLLLHAHTLELPDQAFPELPRLLEAPLPKGFKKRIAELFGEIPFEGLR
jgi:23S rRNA pseudouridine955/2504/2580 synthase